MRLGTCGTFQDGKDKTAQELGQEVYDGRIVGSDLSPHWLNMVEDGRWYGEGRLIIKKVYKLPIHQLWKRFLKE